LKPAAELLLGITKSQENNQNLAGLFAITVQRAAWTPRPALALPGLGRGQALNFSL